MNKFLIKRDRRFWNTCGWSQYRHGARIFQTRAEADQVARAMAANGIACAVVDAK